MHLVVDRLHPDRTAASDLNVLANAFGPLRLVHLRRGDVVRQAVSWARAEQTGYWQRGDVSSREPTIDLDLVDELVRTIEAHNVAWESWFAEQGVQPLVVTYEALAADPEHTVRTILDHLDLKPPATWRPAQIHRKQADEVNADWVRRYRSTRLDCRAKCSSPALQCRQSGDYPVGARHVFGLEGDPLAATGS